MLIGLLGRKRVGKDTVADHIVKKYNYEKRHFADPLKNGIGALFGFNDNELNGNEKDVIHEFWNCKPRTIFQYIGTEIFRKDINKIIPDIGDDFWVKRMEIELTNPMNTVIADVRFQNEVDFIHRKQGIVIKIDNPCIIRNDTHASENIDNIKNYDYEIINDGTLIELYSDIDQLLSSLNE
jgi:hypothetical protein